MGFSMKRFLPLACMAAVVLASCASFQHGQDQGALRQVADLVNAGQAQKLAAMSVVPFLVDGEIVLLQADVAAFWDGIVKAGFRLEGATLDQVAAAGAGSFRQFADTMEVRTFFIRYVKKGARVLQATTSTGARVLLIVKSDWFSWKIIGWKGPY